MSQKGKHDISYLIQDVPGYVKFRKSILAAKIPINVKIVGDLEFDGCWNLELSIGQSDEAEAPIYSIPFDAIWHDLNRRMTEVENKRFNTGIEMDF